MTGLSPSDPLRYEYSPAMKIATMERAIAHLQDTRERIALSYKGQRSSYKIEMGTRLALAEILIAHEGLIEATHHIKHVESLLRYVENSEASSKKCEILLQRISSIRHRVMSEDEIIAAE